MGVFANTYRLNILDTRYFRVAKGRNTLVLNETYRSWLTQMGLTSFEQLMFGDVGCVMEKDHKRDVRRIEGCGRTAYLKRRLTTSMQKSVERYLLDRRAHTAPFNEYLHVCSLQRFQFPVMNPIAAGEQRKLGFPCCGFVLVDEVRGTRLDVVLNHADTQDSKVNLLQSFGRLLARLHKHGFYASLRLKDVIVTDTKEASLVMIDREARHPHPRHRSKTRARRSLDRSFRRIRRNFSAFDEDHMNIVMQSYRSYSNELETRMLSGLTRYSRRGCQIPLRRYGFPGASKGSVL